MGVKAIAIYRDNCKVSQPLSTAKRAEAVEPLGDALIASGAAQQIVEKIVEKVVDKVIQVPTREKLPRQRTSETFDFRVSTEENPSDRSSLKRMSYAASCLGK